MRKRGGNGKRKYLNKQARKSENADMDRKNENRAEKIPRTILTRDGIQALLSLFVEET
jgi:hypothetical protein